MTVRTWLARVSLTGAAGLCVLAALPTSVLHAQDPEAGRPAAWGGEAAANGIFYTTDQRPSLSPIVEFFYAGTPEGRSIFDSSGTAEGRASSYYAGGGGSNAASLLCLAGFPCSQFPGFPPTYPLSANAEYPAKPDASPQASANDASVVPGLTTGVVKAHADRKYVETIAGANNFSSVPATAESSRSTTRQEFLKGVLVVRAESVVKGISLGGVVKIDQVRSVSIARADGKKLLGDESSVTVTGVTVAGQPGSIDDDGIHVAGENNNAATLAANEALKTLKEQGITARVVGVTRQIDRAAGSLQATASGILVNYSYKASGIPTPPPGIPPDPFPGVPNPNRIYFGTMMFGAAGTSIYADDTRFDDIVVPPIVDPGVTPGFDPGTPDPVGVVDGPVLSPGEPVVSDNGIVRAPRVRRPARTTARRVSFGLLPKSVADRIELLYGAGMLSVLAAVAGGRLGSPSRLPRATAR